MLNSLLKRALGLERTVVEGDSIIVSVRPRRAAPRCPVCGRRCAAYDRLRPRRWRAPDLGSSRCHLEYAPVRARCPEHGVRTAPVPWARCASSRFTSAFEDWVAWLALHMCRSALSELARVDWHTVGGICARVEASLEAADGRGRLEGLRRIGVDETSYKKGQRYLTVVVDHDRGRVVMIAAMTAGAYLVAAPFCPPDGGADGVEHLGGEYAALDPLWPSTPAVSALDWLH